VVTYQDTVRQRGPESFDLQVRKYEDPKRQTWQDPKFVIEALGDINGKNIADIGSGTGYFTFQMAVPANKVIAIDIEQRFLNYIEDRKTEMYDRALAKKIETRLTTANTASLKANEVDIVLMVNTIGYITDRTTYLKDLINGIVPGGRIVIIDYKLGKMPVGPEDNLKVGQKEVAAALKVAGFSIQSIDTESLQYQYLIKAVKSN
jgi:ubiquinone/menaquinone biosynthesis C-methylase UbiE